ncbi:hypothetical protein C8J57DRAFT_1482390 [Mycena rebaudengoi]|nr:hypothetical protein C8J57DRAFT_1482390 [Mycena rebaudengoi]
MRKVIPILADFVGKLNITSYFGSFSLKSYSAFAQHVSVPSILLIVSAPQILFIFPPYVLQVYPSFCGVFPFVHCCTYLVMGAQTTHGREASAPLRPLPIGRVSHGKRRSPGRERRTRHRPAAYRTPPRVTAPRVASLPIVALRLAHPRGWQRRMNPRIESHASRHGRSKKKRRREIRGEDKKSAKEKKKKKARTYLVCHSAFAAPWRPPSAHELLHRGSLFVGRRCARRLRRARVTNWSKSSWSILEKAVKKAIGKTEIAMSISEKTVVNMFRAKGPIEKETRWQNAPGRPTNRTPPVQTISPAGWTSLVWLNC